MRKSPAHVVVWILAAAVAGAFFAWAYPRVDLFEPRPWRVDRGQAEAIALSRLHALGRPVPHPYIVVRVDHNVAIERWLEDAVERTSLDRVRAAGLEDEVVFWEVLVYPPGVRKDEWTYRAVVSLGGRVTSLQLRLDPLVTGAPLPLRAARARADAFLRQEGIDSSLLGEPEVRSHQLGSRTDLVLRYPDRRPLPWPGSSHGIQVQFAGDRLAGFDSWLDYPEGQPLLRSLQGTLFLGFFHVTVTYLALVLLAFPFLRRYHAGEIGVRRGGQILLLVVVASVVLYFLTARPQSEDIGLGIATREQSTAIFALIGMIFYGGVSALLAFFAWSTGESICRERWGEKLASFDALFQGAWRSATVARSAVAGVAAGVVWAALLTGILLALRSLSAWPLFALGRMFSGPLPGLELPTFFLSYELAFYLALLLCL
ncbi:MAG: hypothetical protein M3O15_16505, partial [Acidobacteriota bacterium]|nr:hypothetical protein [Acidobacteriota bacterium]